jgi:hypothetical protein
VVTLLGPVLIERGLIFEDYAVLRGTFRENPLRQPGQHTLRSDHYGSKFKFEGDDVVHIKEVEGLKVNGNGTA